MPVNEKLIRETVAQIEAHPETWNQFSFVEPVSVCETTFCFAGTALWLTLGDGFKQTSLNKSSEWFEDEGVKVLGLNEKQMRAIFYCITDDIEELKAEITRVTGVTF